MPGTVQPAYSGVFRARIVSGADTSQGRDVPRGSKAPPSGLCRACVSARAISVGIWTAIDKSVGSVRID